MKFAEMPYQRVDTDAVVAGLKELTQELKVQRAEKSSLRFIKSFMSCVTSTAR